ncbi:hypothetical protein GCM10011360_35680 [Primorskyibacter flagellatus]|uniref:Uncharacterized protein n=1 Tax=Primorskyibacter flagellatus TaxID=1387277 RepID=A0A917AEU6_9RHOB|nr:hypothetical protein [Primorskyibacter flagellatus]GGE45354.1 hypothetical protein GCM10011360_35680 [Primorskyibacter flagellatus]
MAEVRLVVAMGLVGGLALGSPLLSLVNLPVAGDGVLLVLTPPWRDSLPIVERAGGRAIGVGSGPFGRFATGEGPGFATRLRAAGAWAVVDADALAALCGVSPG